MGRGHSLGRGTEKRESREHSGNYMKLSLRAREEAGEKGVDVKAASGELVSLRPQGGARSPGEELRGWGRTREEEGLQGDSYLVLMITSCRRAFLIPTRQMGKLRPRDSNAEWDR